ncbi:MAG: DUF1802 family protein [Geitlerinemataceae cyanobacterium]
MQINKGIQLPALDVELLTLGKLIAIPFKAFVKEGDTFWLYPSRQLPENLAIEDYYQSDYLDLAKTSISKCLDLPIQIKAWGRCEKYWRIHVDRKNVLPQIAESNIWNSKALEKIFEKHQCLKILIVRVYWLSQPCTINSLPGYSNFYFPNQEDIVTDANESDSPVVSSSSFEQRKIRLLSGQASQTLELEKLYFQISEAKKKEGLESELDRDLRSFLGWSVDSVSLNRDSNLDWINTIAALGNRSKTLDTGKSNYQAGTDFENIVRDSLEYLGFTVDYAHKGGAGGLDLFCCQPYPLVIECKAGKKIPNDTAVQLLNLGTLRLQDEKLLQKTAKLIIGPGTPTSQLNDAAKVHGMAILKPETLEKLVKLKSQYPGAIDLFQLKSYLTPGQADDSVEKYLDRIESEIKLRSHLIQTVKTYLENTQEKRVSVHSLYGAYAMSQPPQTLSSQEMHEILVELSSPLTGYLGRDKGQDGSDRFYFLRDLS